MPTENSSTSPLHSVDLCPVCGCGLCGMRICGFDTDHPHGLVICDECEALWTEPATYLPHVFRDSENPCCPICGEAIWGSHSRWANREDLERLGWMEQSNPMLSMGDAEAEI